MTKRGKTTGGGGKWEKRGGTKKKRMVAKGKQHGAARKKRMVAAKGAGGRLRWLEPDEGFRIFRSIDGGTYKQIRVAPLGRGKRATKRRKP